MTQKDLLESVLKELTSIKTDLPNGDLKQMHNSIENLKDAVSEMKYIMLNPENGIVVNNNKNTEFRILQENNAEKYQKYVDDLKDMFKWKEGVIKALWILFTLIIAVICKLIFGIDIEVGTPS